MAETTNEHPIPRSIGGAAFVVDAHGRCNGSLNRHIDNWIVKCAKVRRVRAQAGLTCPRTGQPYEEHLIAETLLMVRKPEGCDVDVRDTDQLRRVFAEGEPYGAPGALVHLAQRNGELIVARFVGNPIRRADGSVDVFTSTDATPDAPAVEGFEPFMGLAILQATRRCSHPDDTWARFAAKVGLAFLWALRRTTDVFEDDFRATDALTSYAYDKLSAHFRTIASGAVDAGAYAAEPGVLDGSDVPGAIHTVGLMPDGNGGAQLVVRLFDALEYSLDVPDIDVVHPVRRRIPSRST